MASNIDEGQVNTLSDLSLIHQMSNVLKLQSGDGVIFFNGNGNEYRSQIVSIGKKTLEFRVEEVNKVKTHSPLKLTLAFSLIKKDNMEWIVQKCTELGVSEFVPLISERSEKKGFNLERAKKILIEACEQSGRGDVPEIYEPETLAKFLDREKRKIIVFHTNGNNFEKEPFLKSMDSKVLELVACVGPEGGWSEKEIFQFKEKGVSIITLNTPILRAETAAVAISILLLVR